MIYMLEAVEPDLLEIVNLMLLYALVVLEAVERDQDVGVYLL